MTEVCVLGRDPFIQIGVQVDVLCKHDSWKSSSLHNHAGHAELTILLYI